MSSSCIREKVRAGRKEWHFNERENQRKEQSLKGHRTTAGSDKKPAPSYTDSGSNQASSLTSEELMNSAEAAKFLRTGVGRIYNLKSAGDLVPTGTNGNRPLYSKEELLRYLRSNM